MPDRVGSAGPTSTTKALYFCAASAALLLGAASLFATDVGGALSGDWTAADSPYRVTKDSTVGVDQTLTIGAGVTVTLAPGVKVTVSGEIDVQGTAEAKVLIGADQPGKPWGGILINGKSAGATLRYLDFTGAAEAPTTPTGLPGAFRIAGGAKVLIEHCRFHDLREAPCIDSSGGSELRVFDSELENTKEGIHSAGSFADIERVHIKDVWGYSDMIDFDDESTPQSIIRDCLLEDSHEDDGIDTGYSSCLIENVTIIGVVAGKALSLEGKSAPVLRNVVIRDCMWGIVSKDSCHPLIDHVTVVGCKKAANFYEKNAGKGPGLGTGKDMIFWGNDEAVTLDALSKFEITFSDVQGGYPGEGNISADPLFVDAAANDFHLALGSPAIGSGELGTDMGAYPYTGPSEAAFVRGDANADGSVDLADGVLILFNLFEGLPAPGCLDALDADDSGSADIADAIRLFGYLFLGEAAPPAPFPEAGTDPTPDDEVCLAPGA